MSEDELLVGMRRVLALVIDALRDETDPASGELASAVHDPRLEAIALARLTVVKDLRISVEQALDAIVRLERHRRRRGEI